MKKIIAFADTDEISRHFDSLLDQGAKAIFPNLRGHGNELRRAELKTLDGQEVELVFINVHLGDLLLADREASEVDIDRVLEAIDKAKDSLLDRVRSIQAQALAVTKGEA